MLFPQLGPAYYDEKDRGILARMEAFYAESITINQSFWGEADTDTRFHAGDQTLWNDLYGNLPANRRRQFSFNRIRRVVNMISGHQRRNRKSLIVSPRENGDSETADQMTKVLMTTMRHEGMLETISEAFEGSLITGMNLLQVWVDYRSDVISGDIKLDKCSYNSFLIDPYFRKSDLSDCNSIWKRSFLTKREVISLLPDKADEIMGLIGTDSGTGRDGKFQFMPESYNYGLKNLLTYDEFYYRDYRTQRMLVDTESGEQIEWSSKDDDKLKLFIQAYPNTTIVEQEIPTVNLAIVVQGKVFYDGPNPLGIDQYPFVPVLTYYAPEMPYFPWRIQGVVRGLRDAQYLYNRRKAIELDILESQINSGWVYKENALVNPKDVFLNGQGRGLALKEEAQMTDVQQIIAPAIPPSTIQLSEIMGKEINEISGVSEELLGFDNKDSLSGFHAALKLSASTTTLQSLFDQLDRAMQLVGERILEVMRVNYTPGKIAKFLGGQQPTKEFYSKAFGKYHVAVEEGLNTTTQKQMQFAQLMDLRNAGIPIPDDALLEAATIQNKKELLEILKKNQEQQSQMQNMQIEAQILQLKSQTELNKARAVADEGLGLERVSRVQENQALAVERRAEAEKDHAITLVNIIKALKELDHMDIEQLEKLMAISHSIKDQTRLDEAQVAAQQQVPKNSTNV